MLLDTALFWFGRPSAPFRVFSGEPVRRTRAFDHVGIRRERFARAPDGSDAAVVAQPLLCGRVRRSRQRAHSIALQMGAEHVHVRTRKLPSGRPDEEPITLEQPDPTWEIEYRYFKQLCTAGGNTSTTIFGSTTCSPVSRGALLEACNDQPVLGFAGMTHLGSFLESAPRKGFQGNLLRSRFHSCSTLTRRRDPRCRSPGFRTFSRGTRSDCCLRQDSAMLSVCDVVYVAQDVADRGPRPQRPAYGRCRRSSRVQRDSRRRESSSSCRKCPGVHPGEAASRQGFALSGGDADIRPRRGAGAQSRALYRKAAADPAHPVPAAYAAFLGVHGCPILPMRFESAELARSRSTCVSLPR